jgi:hypothetical protein
LKKTAEIGLRIRELARKMVEVVKGSEAIVKRLHKRLLQLSRKKGHQPNVDCDDWFLQFAEWRRGPVRPLLSLSGLLVTLRGVRSMR